MDITYLGHASFLIKGKGAKIVTDPFDPEKVGLKYPKVSADIVTVSHNHADHNRSDLISDTRKLVAGPGEYEILGVSIIGISSFHDEGQGSQRGRNTIYVMEIDDLRIAHLGDLGHKLSEDTLEDLGTIDILMIPVGGEYTIGPTVASEMVRMIEPSITIPMHFFLKGMNKESFGNLSGVDEFISEVGLSVERSKKLSAKKNDLGDDKKVVVLEIK